MIRHKFINNRIKENLENMSFSDLQYYLKCLNDEISALMTEYKNNSLSPRRRKKIANNAFKYYATYEELYSYYEPLLNQRKQETVRHLISTNPVFEKFRVLGVIRNSDIDINT